MSMSPAMAFNYKNGHLVYPHLAYAHIMTSNPLFPSSSLMQPPPPSILKRIEESPAYTSPPLERYRFDVEREVLARAKSTPSSVKAETMAQAEAEAAARVNIMLAADARAAELGAKTHAESEVAIGSEEKATGGSELEDGNEEMKRIVTASSLRQFQTTLERIRAEVSIDEIDSASSLDDVDSASSLDDVDKILDENQLGFILRHRQRNGVAQRAKLAAKARAIASQEASAEACAAMWLSIANKTKKKSNSEKAKAAADAADWAISRSLEQAKLKNDNSTKGLTSRLKSTSCDRSSSSCESQGEDQQEKTREAVEKLVRRIVPDEIQNINGMMHQFEGREEELIKTLQTMEERYIAQKARASIHGATNEEFVGTAQTFSPSSRELQPLDFVIENGDWVAVGGLAAKMSRDSSSGDNSDDKSCSSGVSESHRLALHVDTLVAKGDWTGVADAAREHQAT